MKKSAIQIFTIAACLLTAFSPSGCSSQGNKNTGSMKDTLREGTYAADLAFFKENNIAMLELKDSNSSASILLVPAYQGRVMTSTSGGQHGLSYGWINYSFIEAGIKNSQFNPYGGEERLWLGPEGGPFSIYFKQGLKQDFSNWHVPAVLDTEAFDVVDHNADSVDFRKAFKLTNASGTKMQLGLDRRVKILYRNEVENILGVTLDSSLSMVAYETMNTLTNTGAAAWTKESGALSIWLLSMFNTGEKSVVFIPFKSGDEKELGNIVTDDYFGKVPSNRISIRDDIIFFKTDGKKRSKIGLSPERARALCGSYDADKHVLTLLLYSLPGRPAAYVNSKWGPQEDPFKGDVVNSYNDGPLEDGSVMGPFYEIESSSPAAFLGAGQKISHLQQIIHIQGDDSKLNEITVPVFGLTTEDIKKAF